MKRLFSLLLTVVMIMSMGSVVCAVDFTDVETTHDNYEAIETLESLGIVNGYVDDTYGPDKVLTRAELATMLTRAMYTIHYNSTNVFTDVPVNHWARPYIDTAHRNGLMVGNGDGTFTPDENLTYTQIARTILNALGYGTLDWPVGVNTVAYELGLYDNINVIDFEAGCIRAHAAQMIFNAFDLQCVRQYAGQHFVTNKTFLKDLLGYEVTTEYVNGHVYTAYKKISNGKIFVTDLRETYEATIYPAKGKGGDMGYGYKLSKRGTVTEVNWYWVADNKRPPVYCYVNGVEITVNSEKWFAACESATGVFDSNDNLIAIYIVNAGTVYAPTNCILNDPTVPEWIKFELQYNSEFNKDVSTVTYFAENETYIISNTIVYGFATGASFNYLEVDGVRYTVARIPYDYVRNAFVMLYIDQAGAVADYVFNADPYVFNLNTRTYHTIECMLYRYSFLENWVTFNEIGNHIKSDDGIAIFVGCPSCHTNGTWKPVTVPTGYVTVDGWNYYHTPTCSYIVETTKEVIPVTNILTTTLQRHECCGNH